MATISLNDTGKAVGEPIHFSLAHVSFDLADAEATYTTDDPATISDAKTNPWLAVDESAETPAEPATPSWAGSVAVTDDTSQEETE
jgi:hypothetical protein